GIANYRRTTSNATPPPGTLPMSVASMAPPPNFDTFNYYSFGLTLGQSVYDLGAIQRFRSARVGAQAFEASELTAELNIEVTVRTAFFQARAQKDLVGVARETLENQERHLKQIQAFVEVGTRP